MFPDEAGSARKSAALPVEEVVVVKSIGVVACDTVAGVIVVSSATDPAAIVAWVDIVAPEQVEASVLPHPFKLHPASQYPSES